MSRTCRSCLVNNVFSQECKTCDDRHTCHVEIRIGDFEGVLCEHCFTSFETLDYDVTRLIELAESDVDPIAMLKNKEEF